MNLNTGSILVKIMDRNRQIYVLLIVLLLVCSRGWRFLRIIKGKGKAVPVF